MAVSSGDTPKRDATGFGGKMSSASGFGGGGGRANQE